MDDPNGTSGGVPPVLPRNTACHQCRKRKLKCDAVRPTCANCTKRRPRINPNGERQCTWDDTSAVTSAAPTARGGKRKVTEEAGGRRGRLVDLEERVKAFEAALLARQKDSQPAQHGDTQIPPAIAADGYPNNISERNSTDVPGHAAQVSISQPSVETAEITNLGVSTFAAPPNPFLDWETGAGQRYGEHISSTQDWIQQQQQQGGLDSASDLVWPDWPQELPSLDVVEHIIRVFFDKVPLVPKMLHRSTFLSHLQLPPSHINFPAPVLLHAILGVTAPLLPSALLATRAYFPIGTPSAALVHPEKDFDTGAGSFRNLSGAFHSSGNRTETSTDPIAIFQAWHRRKALQGLAAPFEVGDKLLDAVQALVAVCHIDIANAWWTDVWMEAGSCIRMALPLRLNESPRVPDDKLERFKLLLVTEAQDPLEQARRDRTWWLAYMTERSVNMCTNWAECITDDEITVELPVVQAVFDSGDGQLQGVQTLQSPDLFSSQPAIHSDGFCLLVKSLKLHTDVSRFFRQYGRGSHSTAGYLNHPSLPKFLAQINSFRLSFPPHLRRPTQEAAKRSDGRTRSLDVNLVTAILIIHATTLNLVEPLVTKEMADTDMAKIGLSAIRAVLSVIYDITSTSFDLGLLPCCCTFVLLLCAKGLLRFREAATMKGDMIAAAVYRSECEVFRMALRQHGERFPVGNRHLDMLDGIIQQQDAMLLMQNERAAQEYTQKRILYPPGAPGSGLQCGAASTSSSTPPTTSVYTSPASVPTSYIAPPEGRTLVQLNKSVPTPSRAVWTTVYPTAADPDRPCTDGSGPKTNLSRENESSWGQAEGIMVYGQDEPNMRVLPGGLPAQNVLGFDTGSWFDIPNLTFDMEQVAALMSMAQENGAMFDLSSSSG